MQSGRMVQIFSRNPLHPSSVNNCSHADYCEDPYLLEQVCQTQLKHGPFNATGKIHAGHITFTTFFKIVIESEVKECGSDN
jgi:hypothetical protein